MNNRLHFSVSCTLYIILLVYSGSVFSQGPSLKKWDYRYGGGFDEVITCFYQTSDSGFMIGGYSYSGMSGDKSQPNWAGGGASPDYWIVKTDSQGVKQWDKRFGGTSVDCLTSLSETSDGGYILGGYSNSYIGGDKTQAEWGLSFDYWIVKIDSAGFKQWDYRFGGTDDDKLFSICQTNDGGYLLGGFSGSGISGDKTQNSRGGNDYWIVKTDSLGIKQWDKRYGGTDDDELYSLKELPDGSFICGGSSSSGNSGDKTQASRGDFDYWVIKTDAAGVLQWNLRYGGSDYDYFNSIDVTTDGGFILGGYSNSPAGGDKSQPLFGAFAGPDFWIVKTDSAGVPLWDKDFGGIGIEDAFGNVIQTNEGGYLLTGSSYSSIGGEKSEANLGQEQTWTIKTDSRGNKEWDKTLFTPGHDEVGFALKTFDGCYAFADYSDGNIGGYKTWPSWNNTYDFWIVKFCDSIVAPQAGFVAANPICPGTCADFMNLSINATSFQWFFSGATVSYSTDLYPVNICYNAPGSYDVMLIATNGNGSDTLLLSNYMIVYPFPPPQSITQSGDTLFALAGSSMYQWYFNNNIITGATNYFYLATQSGNYNVVATDTNGCEVEAVINNVIAETASPDNYRYDQTIQVYPNPVNDKFIIHNLKVTSGTTFEIFIYNLLGEKVMAVQQGTGNWEQGTIDCRFLPRGIYYIEISQQEKIYRSKFVKQ